jgi:2-aminoadipate transaminase
MINYEKLFSKNAMGLKRSEIRELLKVTRIPGIISFAGGLPAPNLFPVKDVKDVTDYILEKEGKIVLQYGPTEGDTRLKEELVRHMKDEGIETAVDNILIVSASQQALDLVAKIFLNRKDFVFVEEPTYVGGIQAFNSYGANMVAVKSDKDGILPESLEANIKTLISKGFSDKLKLIYIIPDFQNPAGITTSEERRKKILDIAERYDLIVIEDTPYRQLRYSGNSVTPMITLDKSDRVLSLFTFSKIFAPGFRLGWIVGPKEIIEKIIMAKQAADLCTSPFTQSITYEYLKRGYLEKQINIIRKDYMEKRDKMLSSLEKYMPKLEGLSWTHPEGGLFLWVNLPEYMDSRELFLKAIDKKVAFVIGEAFHPQAKCKNAFRLNFSYATKENIDEGIKRLANAIKEYEEEIKNKKLGDSVVFP